MKKFLNELTVFLLLLMVVFSFIEGAQPLKAASLNDAFNNNLDKFATDQGVGYQSNAGKDADIYKSIGQIIKLFLTALGVIFLGLIIYAGTEWMQAMGNDEKVKKAQDTLRNATIGFVITVAAYALSDFVMSSVATFFIK